MADQNPVTEPVQDDPALKRLWANIGKKNKDFTVSYEQFEQDMQDEENLKSLHSNLPKIFDGYAEPFDEFAQNMGTKKKSGGNASGPGAAPADDPFNTTSQVTAPPADIADGVGEPVPAGTPMDAPPAVPTQASGLPEQLPQPFGMSAPGSGFAGSFDNPAEQEQARAMQMEAEAATGEVGTISPRYPELTQQSADGLQQGRAQDEGKRNFQIQSRMFADMVASQKESDWQRDNAGAEAIGLGGVGDFAASFYNAVVPGGARMVAATVDYADQLTASLGYQGTARQAQAKAGVKPRTGVVTGLQDWARNNTALVSPDARKELAKDWSSPRAWSAALGSGAGSIALLAGGGAVGGAGVATAMGAGLALDETGQAADAAGLTADQKLAMQSVLAPVIGLLEEAGLGAIVKNPAFRKLLGRSIVAGAGGQAERKALVSSASKLAAKLVPAGKQFIKQGAKEGGTEGLQSLVSSAYKLAFDAAQDNEGKKQGNGSFGSLENGLGEGVTDALRSAGTDAVVGAMLGGALGAAGNVGGQQNAPAPAEVQFTPEAAPAESQTGNPVPEQAAPAEAPAAQPAEQLPDSNVPQSAPEPAVTAVPTVRLKSGETILADLDENGQAIRAYTEQGQEFSLENPDVKARIEAAAAVSLEQQPITQTDEGALPAESTTLDSPQLQGSSEPSMGVNQQAAEPAVEDAILPAELAGASAEPNAATGDGLGVRVQEPATQAGPGNVVEPSLPKDTVQGVAPEQPASYEVGQTVTLPSGEQVVITELFTSRGGKPSIRFKVGAPKLTYEQAREKATEDVWARGKRDLSLEDVERLYRSDVDEQTKQILWTQDEAQGQTLSIGIDELAPASTPEAVFTSAEQAAKSEQPVSALTDESYDVAVGRASYAVTADESGGWQVVNQKTGQPLAPGSSQHKAAVNRAVGQREAATTKAVQVKANNTAVEAVRDYNAQNGVYKNSKKGTADRQRLTKLASDAGLTLTADRSGRYQLTTPEGKRVTAIAQGNTLASPHPDAPLAARSKDVQAAAPFLLDAAEADSGKNIGSALADFNLKQYGFTSSRDVKAAVADVRAGRQTVRAAALLDVVEQAVKRGYYEVGDPVLGGFPVPVGPLVKGEPSGDISAWEGRETATDEELADIIAADEELGNFLDSISDTDGNVDMATLAQRLEEDGQSDFPGLDHTSPGTQKLRDYATQQARSPEPAAGKPTPDSGTQEPAGSVPAGAEASAQEVAPKKPTLRERNVAAKQELSAALAEFRAARKQKSNKVFSSAVGFAPFSEAEAAAIVKAVKALVKLGYTNSRIVVQELRGIGFDEDDATDAQLLPAVKQVLKDEGVFKAKKKPGTRTPKEGERATVVNQLNNPSISEQRKARLESEVLNYTPKPHTESEQQADEAILGKSLAEAYDIVLDTDNKLPADARLLARDKVSDELDRLAVEAAEAGNQELSDEYLEMALTIDLTKADENTRAGQLISANRALTRYSPKQQTYQARKVVAAKAKVVKAQVQRDGKAVTKEARKAQAEAVDATLKSPAVAAAKAAVVPAAAKPESVAYGSKNKLITKEKYAQLKMEWKKLAFSTIVPPQLIAGAVFHLEAGTRAFADVAAKLTRDFGAKAKPFLKDAYNQAASQFIQNGGDPTGLQTAQAVDAATQAEQAELLANRIVAEVKGRKPIQAIDPVKRLLDTLTAKVTETLPKPAKQRTIPANEALAAALSNRAEYAAVFEAAKVLVEKQIADAKADASEKQRMMDELQGFYAEIIGQPYANKQFARAIDQAEDVMLAARAGMTPATGNRTARMDAIATGTDASIATARAYVVQHVTQALPAGDPALVAELADAAGAEFDRRVAERQRALRVKNGVGKTQPSVANDEQNAGPVPKPTAQVKPLSQKVTELLAMRAEPSRVAGKVAQDAVRESLQDLGLKLDNVVRRHISEQNKAGQTLADRLVKEAGLDPAQAKEFAAAMEQEFQRQIAARSETILNRMYSLRARLNLGRKGKTALDKTIELLNLSPLDEKRIIGLVAEQADIPELTVADLKQIRALAEAVEQAPEGRDKDKAVRELNLAMQNIKGISLLDLAQAMWYANVLSSYATHAVNFTANTYQGLMEGLLATGNVAIAGGRALAPAMGLGRGLKAGAKLAKEVLTTGYEPSQQAGKYEVPSTLEAAARAGNRVAGVLKYVPRLLKASDVFYQTGLREMRAWELAALEAAKEGRADPTRNTWEDIYEKLGNTTQRQADAAATATAEGRTGRDHALRVWELMEQSRPMSVREDSRIYATRAVFNGEMEGTLGVIFTAVSSLVEKAGPVGKWVIPFARVITNVANAYLDYTLYGFVRAAKNGTGFGKSYQAYTGDQRGKLIAKATLGAAVWAALYALTHHDDPEDDWQISGPGPRDMAQRHQLLQQGWRPYAVKVDIPYLGERWVSYKESPLFFVIGTIGAIKDKEIYEKKKPDDDGLLDGASLLMFRTLGMVVETTATKNLSEFLDALTSSGNFGGEQAGLQSIGRYIGNTLGYSLTGYVPGSGLLRQISRDTQDFMDVDKVQAKRAWEVVQQDIPIFRSGLLPALDALGEPMKVQSDRLVSGRPTHRDAKTQELWDALTGKGVGIPVPNQRTTVAQQLQLEGDGKLPKDGNDQKQWSEVGPLPDKVFHEFLQIRGGIMKEQLLANLDVIKGMKPAELREEMAKLSKRATHEAKRRLVIAKLSDEVPVWFKDVSEREVGL